MFGFGKKKDADKAADTSSRDPVIDQAMKRWRRADEADRENRDAAYEDLAFLEVPGAQWTEEAKRIRGDRPTLEFNRLPTTIAQITGDIRQMRPSIKVVPVDSRGDPDTAETIAGMVRYVENRSDAAAAYFSAADQQVGAGIGHWQVTTEYGSDSTFEQEIRITGIPDGVGVRWDPDAVLPTREDALFCFVPLDMSRDVYEEKYPDHPAAEIGADGVPDGWSTNDAVRVSVYWRKVPVKKKLALMPDGEIVDLTDGDPEGLAMAQAANARIEERDGYQVERYLISASAVLEGPMKWPGRFIPVVPVVGVEMQIAKRRVRRGVVRLAKDAQRAYNYARSTQTEVVALQPKAPFTGSEAMFKGYEQLWATANTENHAFLVHGIDPKAPMAKPERVAPPVPSAGLAELTREAAEDMKAVTGVYDASLGARSNETSGKAIMARQREGDVGSFVYVVNFTRSIRHTGAIVVDLIPHIYDTARTLRIVGEDGKVDLVDINKAGGLADDDQPLDKIQNDVTVGAYDVAMEMGPSYTTRREAAFDGMVAFVQAAPDVAPLVLDLLAKAQDWPLADKLAKRLRTLLPPQIQAEEAKESGEDMPPPPPQPPGAELEAAKLQLEHGKLAVDEMKVRADMAKIQAEIERIAIDAARPVADPGGPAGAAPAVDPRVDAIAQGLEQLSQVVSMLFEAMATEETPPLVGEEASEPLPPDLGELPLLPTEPPSPGGFFVDATALGAPPAELGMS